MAIFHFTVTQTKRSKGQTAKETMEDKIKRLLREEVRKM